MAKRVLQNNTSRPKPDSANISPALPDGWRYIKEQVGLRFVTPTFGLWKDVPVDTDSTFAGLLGWPGVCRGYMGPEISPRRFTLHNGRTLRILHLYTLKNPPYTPMYIVTDETTRFDLPRSECTDIKDPDGNQKRRRILF